MGDKILVDDNSGKYIYTIQSLDTAAGTASVKNVISGDTTEITGRFLVGCSQLFGHFLFFPFLFFFQGSFCVVQVSDHSYAARLSGYEGNSSNNFRKNGSLIKLTLCNVGAGFQ